MKDVVKTSALSKQWRYLWTSFSTLSFNGDYAMEVGTRKFITFVYKALILCKSPKMEKFVLILKYSPCFAFDLNIFISFAIQNNVEDLELLLDFRRSKIECYRLPQYIYCSSSLKKLKLNCCDVLSILEVKGVPFQLSSCKSLALNTYVNRWDSPAIASLLRSSPNLETLVINMTPPCGEGVSFPESASHFFP
ncbi:F-box/FBD/LRR-repeat protein [Camellia lanceoleosa]|uniref:F-box/FBD/LRR-repeat protein n=1 Tax=Camellia lanceoleosa TaxID=1840588 RepID=A0ACC0GHP5_9ERIC|nr:F-box/FBD/LRR-repeat protein [Camellia lanceoleosa]